MVYTLIVMKTKTDLRRKHSWEFKMNHWKRMRDLAKIAIEEEEKAYQQVHVDLKIGEIAKGHCGGRPRGFTEDIAELREMLW